MQVVGCNCARYVCTLRFSFCIFLLRGPAEARHPVVGALGEVIEGFLAEAAIVPHRFQFIAAGRR